MAVLRVIETTSNKVIAISGPSEAARGEAAPGDV
jgi:hypothetical protein